MKPTDPRNLVVLLDMLSVREAHGEVTLPSYAAAGLVAILNSLPGRAKPSASEYRALMAACDGKPLVMLSSRGAHGEVTLPSHAADALTTLLNSLPGRANRPHRGPSTSEYRALMDARDGKPLNVMAREIAEQTDQPERTVRRRLQEIRKRRRSKAERRVRAK